MKFSYLTLICSLLLFGVSRAADLPESEQALVNQVNEILRSSKSTPPQLIVKLTQLRELSQAQNWNLGFIHSTLLETELLTSLSEFSKATVLYEQLQLVIDTANDETLKIRLEVVGLSLDWVNQPETLERSDFLELTSQAQSVTDNFVKSSILLNIADQQYVAGYYNDAIASYQTTFDLIKNAGRPDILGQISNSMSNIYSALGDYDKTLYYLEQALDIAVDINHQYGKAVVASNIGRVHIKEENYDKAKSYIDVAYEVRKNLNDHVGAADLLSDKSYIELKLGNWQQSIEYALQALPVLKESDATLKTVHAMSNLAIANTMLKQADIAQDYLSETQQYANKSNNRLAWLSYYDAAFQVYEGLGNYEKASQFLMSYMKVQEDMKQSEYQQRIELYQTQLDYSIKDAENAALKIENIQKSAQIEEQKKQAELRLIILVLVAALFLITCLYLLNIIRNRNYFKAIALRDHLTGAPNRQAILQFASLRYNEAKHTGMPLCICMLDFDNFKTINDTYGHDIGDQVLRLFTNVCEKTLRTQDKFGRYGGEEWLIVIANADVSHIEKVFSRLREQLNITSVKPIPNSEAITFSVGVAIFEPKSDDSIQNIINRADEKLYQAKNAGRDRVVF